MSANPISRLDRVQGCLVGLAVGDAVGTTLEFEEPGTFKLITDMVGGGPFHLGAGQWTDDTSMALCLAVSLAHFEGFDPKDQMERYCRWRREGYMSSTHHCFDIGMTVAGALRRFESDGNPFAGRTSPDSAGNGSLMRLAPVPMFYSRDLARAIELSGESSRTTHGTPMAVDACRYYAALLLGAFDGVTKERLLAPAFKPDGQFRSDELHPRIFDVAGGSFKRKQPLEIRGTGFVVDSLEAALWSFYTTANFRDCILAAANLGQDADTTAAIAGQLAGAHYGLSGIPADWLRKLHERSTIEDLARELYDFSEKAAK